MALIRNQRRRIKHRKVTIVKLRRGFGNMISSVLGLKYKKMLFLFSYYYQIFARL